MAANETSESICPMILSPLLTDHAVLQRDRPIAITGTTHPGARVTASFRAAKAQTAADPTGHFFLELGPFVAGGPDDLYLSAAGDSEIRIRNILIGDVWVCAGQSNMEMALQEADGGPAAAAAAQHPALRLFRVPNRTMLEPQLTLPTEAAWRVCEPAAASEFSAIGYYFAKHLLPTIGVPVGLVQATVSNTPGEAWVPRPVLLAQPEYRPILDRWQAALAAWPDEAGTYPAAFARWDRETDQAEQEGRLIPGAHPKLIGPGHPWTPAGLWNAMVFPLTGFPIRGVLWYQGAGAPERADQYRSLFRHLIRAWRAAWGQGDFPFLYLQEANFGPRRTAPGEHSWAELREAQSQALAEPNTAMGVALDVGEEKNIHPLRKEPLGERLALAARALVYGQSVAWSSPFFQSVRFEGRYARVRFAPAGGGLRTTDGAPPRGFAISAGATDFQAGNRGFEWAETRIEGDTVVAWSDRISSPQAVRYAWAQNPDVNLVNQAGLPAAPFRTDDWPGVTVNNQ